MKLLQFAVSSVVVATTGSHLTQTSNRIDQTENTQYQARQTRASILQIIQNKVASVSLLISQLATANRRRLQQNKDTVQILQLNDHYLKDIGLTHDDLADLRSGQRSLKELSSLHLGRKEIFNLKLKKAATSKIENSNLKAANQEPCEFASCG
jgi:uncharacterized protein YjiS (DUF1127 family)